MAKVDMRRTRGYLKLPQVRRLADGEAVMLVNNARTICRLMLPRQGMLQWWWKAPAGEELDLLALVEMVNERLVCVGTDLSLYIKPGVMGQKALERKAKAA